MPNRLFLAALFATVCFTQDANPECLQTANIAASKLGVAIDSPFVMAQVEALRPSSNHFRFDRLRCSDCTSCHSFPYCKPRTLAGLELIGSTQSYDCVQ